MKAAYRRIAGLDVEQASSPDLAGVANALLSSRQEFLESVWLDARKEFDKLSAVGFGTDGPPEAKELDFQTVRGDHDSNAFVMELRSEIVALSKRVERFKQLICHFDC